MIRNFFLAPLVSVNLRYGAIAGALCGGSAISMYYMGKHPFLVNPFFDFRVPAYSLLLFFSLKEVRDYFKNGVLTFFHGLGGSIVFMTTAALVSITIIVLFGFLQPEFLTAYIHQLSNQLRSLPPDSVEQIGKEALQKTLDEIPNIDMGYLAGLYAWQTVQIGFFISVIISVILRRQPKQE